MAIKLTTTSVAAANHGVKALVYGRTGVGKTTLCGTAPNNLIISAESGLLSLGDKNIPVIEIESFMDIAEAYRFVTESAEATQFETISLDSISEIAEQCLAHERATNKDARAAYGELATKMSEVIRSFRDLPERNVYFAAKSGYNKDEQTGITMYGPSMPGQTLTKNLGYFFDLVMQLEIGADAEGNSFRYLRTAPTISIEAKDRSNKLEAFEAPDLGAVFQKIRGGVVAPTTGAAE